MIPFNDHSLERLAKISFVTSLWEKKKIKQKVKKFFRTTRSSTTNLDQNEQEWALITQEVMKEIDGLYLPPFLDFELRNIIKASGINLFNFVKYVTKNLWIKWNWKDKIPWTCRLTLDVSKMVYSAWINVTGMDIEKNFSFYYVAAGCGLLSVIQSNLDTVKLILEYYSDRDRIIANGEWFPPNRRLRLLACSYLYVQQVAFCVQLDALNPFNRPFEVGLFQLCLLEGFVSGVEFYWGLMRAADKIKILIHAVKCCVKMYDYSKKNGARHYITNNYVEILAFIYGKMSDRMKKELISIKGSFLCKVSIMLSSSYEDFFLDLYELKKKSENGYVYENFYFSILNSLSKKVGKEEKLGFDVKKSASFKLFKYVWFTIPSSVKAAINGVNYTSSFFYCHLAGQLLERSEISCLKVIFYSEIFHKPEFLIDRICSGLFWDLMDSKCDNTFDLIKKFRSEILSTEDDRIKFNLSLLDLSMDFLKQGAFDQGDLILVCLSNTFNLDRASWKNKLDVFQIIECMICKYNLRGINKFLKWYFNCNKEAGAFVTVLKQFDFVSDMIVLIWVKIIQLLVDNEHARGDDYISEEYCCINESKSRMERFLSWILNSNDEIEFKKFCFRVELIEKFVKKFCDTSFWKIGKNLEIKIIEEVLKFFSAGEIEINAIKQNFVKNAPYWIKFCLIEKQSVHLVEILFDWCCTKDEKLDLWKKYLKSEDGVVLFNLMPKRFNEYRSTIFVQFLNGTVKPNVAEVVEIKNSLKMSVDDLMSHDSEDLLLGEFIVQKTLKLFLAFEKLEMGEDVDVSDF